MKKLVAGVCLGFFITLVACGGNVNVGGSGGSGGTGSNAVACSNTGSDEAVTGLENKPCDTEDQVCSSNNGCGGCSVTCKNGKWTSTDTDLCYSIGSTC